MILICLANARCLADPENPETSLVVTETPQFHMTMMETLKFAFP